MDDSNNMMFEGNVVSDKLLPDLKSCRRIETIKYPLTLRPSHDVFLLELVTNGELLDKEPTLNFFRVRFGLF